MSEMAELKPCPFCGEKNIEVFIHEYHGWPSYSRTYKVICFSCSAQLYRGSKEEVIAAWNRRAGEDG